MASSARPCRCPNAYTGAQEALYDCDPEDLIARDQRSASAQAWI